MLISVHVQFHKSLLFNGLRRLIGRLKRSSFCFPNNELTGEHLRVRPMPAKVVTKGQASLKLISTLSWLNITIKASLECFCLARMIGLKFFCWILMDSSLWKIWWQALLVYTISILYWQVSRWLISIDIMSGERAVLPMRPFEHFENLW